MLLCRDPEVDRAAAVAVAEDLVEAALAAIEVALAAALISVVRISTDRIFTDLALVCAVVSITAEAAVWAVLSV